MRRPAPLLWPSLVLLLYLSVLVGCAPANLPPQITSEPLTIGTVDTAYSYDVKATDPDGDSLTYALVAAPAGMMIHPTTGLISWTPVTSGDFPVQVQVSDGRGGSGNQAFTVTVSEALVPAPNIVGM